MGKGGGGQFARSDVLSMCLFARAEEAAEDRLRVGDDPSAILAWLLKSGLLNNN
jgi:hypothetical protein